MNAEYYHDYYYNNQGMSIDNKNALQCLQNYQPSIEKSSYFHYSAKSDGWRSPSPNSFRSSSPEFIPLTSSIFSQLPVNVEIKQAPTHKISTASNCFYVKKEAVSDLENQISDGSVFTHESIENIGCENVKISKKRRSKQIAPVVKKKRRLAANMRERKRMQNLNQVMTNLNANLIKY